MSYTKGPWKVESEQLHINWSKLITDNNNTVIAQTSSVNAELIAKAPWLDEINNDLLEACKQALQAFQLLGSGQNPPLSNSEYCDLIGKAIAKAEGRE